VRRLLLIGRVDDAEGRLADLDSSRFRPALRAALELTAAGVAMRRLRTNDARRAIARARRAAAEARIPALIAEAEATAALLEAPAAQRISRGKQRLLRLAEVETLLASEVLVVDACRRAVRQSGKAISLATRPVLFALARALAEAWPGDAPRDALLARAFGAREADESHRSRLRVEVGRLRALLRPLARLTATKGGFSLSPRGARTVAVLAPPSRERTPPCSRCSRTASRGRARRSRWRSERASAPCNARSTRWRPRAGPVLSAARGRAGG
jgi:hypothetical protein